MITILQYRQALAIVDNSGVAGLLKRLMYPNPQGRRGPLTQRAYLVGMLLSLIDTGRAHYREVHALLTRRLPPAAQIELGIVEASDNDDGTTTLTLQVHEHHLYNFTRKLRASVKPDQPLSDDLHEALLEIAHELISQTLPVRPQGSTGFAIDESGHWAHSIGRRDRGDSQDVEAAWSGKTAKDGTTEMYFGYSIHAVVRTPAAGHDGSSEPLLLAAFDLTPAGTDLVDTSLGILDRLLDADVPIGDLIGDRHYSYKRPERWAVPLRERDIRQVVDLREDEHGFHDVDGTRVAAGSPHCPATPDVYGKHVRPEPGDDPTPEDYENFQEFIAARQQWALERRSTPWSDRIRYRCPARAGTLGCDLVDGSVEVADELGLPVVDNPPDGSTAPKCCTQETVTLKAADVGQKHIQQHYWGSLEWHRAYAARTHVEGWFGTAKTPSKAKVSRQSSNADCRGLRLLYVALAATATNLQLLQRWHERHGDDRMLPGVDPLLIEEEPDMTIRVVPTSSIAV